MALLRLSDLFYLVVAWLPDLLVIAASHPEAASLNCTGEGRPHGQITHGKLLPVPPWIKHAVTVNFTFVVELKFDQAIVNSYCQDDKFQLTSLLVLATAPLDTNDSVCFSSFLASAPWNLVETSNLFLLFVLPSSNATAEQSKMLQQQLKELEADEWKDRAGIMQVNTTSSIATCSACLLSLGRPKQNTGLPDDTTQPSAGPDNMLTNFSRTSVLFVSISFIILMVISLAWLLFYYVQRFRYAHAKDRLARRLFNAAKKALTKIPAKALRHGDKELDSDCPVCIEPYRLNDIIRILPCKHLFHKSCVDPWLLEHRTCPMCKMDILKAFGYQFCHNSSQDSVHQIDGDQLSGATSTDGRNSFPLPLSVESDLHDPFFPSPAPSPSLVQPVMHQSNAQGYAIIPLTVHGVSLSSRVSESSECSNNTVGDLSDSYGAGGSVRPLFQGTSAEVHRRLTTSSSGSTDEATFFDNSTNSSPEKFSTMPSSGLTGHHVQKACLLRPTRSMIVHAPKAIVTIIEDSSLFPFSNETGLLASRSRKVDCAVSTSPSAQAKRSFSLPSEANVPCSNG